MRRQLDAVQPRAGPWAAPDLTPIPNHPLAPLAGKYDNDPAWDEWMEGIRQFREEMNALEAELIAMEEGN